MNKVYITGPKQINIELIKLVGKNVLVATNPGDADIVIESTAYPPDKKLETINKLDGKIDSSIPIITSSLCVPVYEQSTVCKNPDRLIGIGLYNSMSSAKRLEIAPSKITSGEILRKTETFFKNMDIMSQRNRPSDV